MSSETEKGIYSELAASLRSQRVARMTEVLVASEGQQLQPVLLNLSKSLGRSMRTINEYWEVISVGGLGPIYEKHGIIKVRRSGRKGFFLNGKVPKVPQP